MIADALIHTRLPHARHTLNARRAIANSHVMHTTLHKREGERVVYLKETVSMNLVECRCHFDSLALQRIRGQSATCRQFHTVRRRTQRHALHTYTHTHTHTHTHALTQTLHSVYSLAV